MTMNAPTEPDTGSPDPASDLPTRGATGSTRAPSSGSTTSSVGTRIARPRLALAVWMLVLGALAAVAPLVQSGLGVPWEVTSLIMFAPAIAGAIALPLCRPAPPNGRWRAVGGREFGSALLGTAIAIAAYLGAMLAFVGTAPALPPTIAGLPLALVLAVQFLAALGEEVGWRGFVQRTGERLGRPWVVLVTAGIVFGATHLGYWSMGPLFVALFTLSSLAMVLTIGLVWRGSFWQRMLPAALIHFTANTALVAFGLEFADVPVWMMPVPALVMLAVTALFRLVIDRHVARRPGADAAPIP